MIPRKCAPCPGTKKRRKCPRRHDETSTRGFPPVPPPVHAVRVVQTGQLIAMVIAIALAFTCLAAEGRSIARTRSTAPSA